MLTTGFGLGYLPVCPGSFGTLEAIGVYFLLLKLSPPFHLGIIIFVFLLGVWISNQAEVIWKKKDPGEIIIDEIVGYLITMGLLPFSLIKAIAGFLLFRIFDIFKPFPIRRIERIGGGWGIMLDDAIAGLYAALILRVLFRIRI
ncbi:MAG: phosphatidylglycerophosphatase A [bacterium]